MFIILRRNFSFAVVNLVQTICYYLGFFNEKKNTSKLGTKINTAKEMSENLVPDALTTRPLDQPCRKAKIYLTLFSFLRFHQLKTLALELFATRMPIVFQMRKDRSACVKMAGVETGRLALVRELLSGQNLTRLNN